MGIRGLSTYLQNQDHLFERSTLQNTKLVIDGSNLWCTLYKSCPSTNSIFGGDYDKVSHYIHHYFSVLEKCGVEPVIVMDGGRDLSGIKEKTMLDRKKESYHNATKDSYNSRDKVRPVLGSALFMAIIKQRNIKVVRPQFEADEVLARVALEMDAPVLSNDSDFFIYPVRYAILSSVDIEASKDSGALHCRIFNRDKFLELCGLSDPELLYLMASILGNDYIPLGVFEKLFSLIKLDKYSKRISYRHRQIKGLLKWLSKEKDAELALRKVLGFFTMQQRPGLEDKVRKSMAVYRNGLCADETNWQLVQSKYFSSRFATGSFPCWTMDAITVKKASMSCGIEKSDRPTGISYTFPIMEKICSILVGFGDSETEEPVKIIGRVRHGIETLFSIHPNKDCFLEDDQLMSLSNDQRCKIVLEAFGCDIPRANLDQLPADLVLITLALDYWSRQEDIRVTKDHVCALFLCRFLLTHVDPETQRARNDIKIRARLASCPPNTHQHACLSAALNFAPFFWVEKHLQAGSKQATKRIFDRGLVHNWNVFQTVLGLAFTLNTLLDSPFEDPDFAQLYNGTFIYNWAAMAEEQPSYADPLEACTNRLPDMLKERFEVDLARVLACLKHLGQRAGSTANEVKSRRNKKAEAKSEGQVRKKESFASEDLNSHESSSESNDDEFELDMNNRFAFLSVK